MLAEGSALEILTNMYSNTNNSTYNSSRSSRVQSVMDPTDEAIFTGGLDDVTTVSKILQELHHTEDHAVLVITREGIRLILSGAKTYQVSAFFSSIIFQRYKYDYENQDKVIFRFILRDFIEILNLLRDDPIVEGDKFANDDGPNNDMMKTSLYIQYRRKGDPLRLRLENKSNYVINCDLKAFSMPGDSLFNPLAFQEGEETAMIVMNSKKLYEYVSGLDLHSSEFVHLSMGKDSTPLRLVTQSTTLGEVELEITENEREIIQGEIHVSDNCLFSFSYRTQFMKPALDALKSSLYVEMKCGSSGLLCIEHFHVKDDKPFVKSDMNYMTTTSTVYPTNYNQPQTKRSSVEYFILSEAKPLDE